jgi:peptidoglycan/LPS O-acetylase OafA/YrhL
LIYLLFPLVIFAVRPPWSLATATAVVVIAIALSILLPALRLHYVSSDILGRILGLASYLPCFVLGSLIAKYPLPRSTGLVAMVAGLLAVLVAPIYPAMNVHVGFAFLYAGLIVVALDDHSIPHRVLSGPLPVWLGERSYSLFLTHYAVFYSVFYLIGWFFPRNSLAYLLGSRLVMLPLSLFVAMLLFWFVERRFARNLHTGHEFWPPIRLAGGHSLPTAPILVNSIPPVRSANNLSES